MMKGGRRAGADVDDAVRGKWGEHRLGRGHEGGHRCRGPAMPALIAIFSTVALSRRGISLRLRGQPEDWFRSAFHRRLRELKARPASRRSNPACKRIAAPPEGRWRKLRHSEVGRSRL